MHKKCQTLQFEGLAVKRVYCFCLGGAKKYAKRTRPIRLLVCLLLNYALF